MVDAKHLRFRRAAAPIAAAVAMIASSGASSIDTSSGRPAITAAVPSMRPCSA
jgi:hypothetical protein